MPVGILQPGGAGTEVFVYDHVNGAADPANGYDLLEIHAAAKILDPAGFEDLTGPVSGLVYGGARKQIMWRRKVTIGGQNADGTNATWIKGSNVDLYLRDAGQLNYRTIGYSNGLFRTKFGTRLAVEYGTVKHISGRDGVDIVTLNQQIIRGQYLLYGSEIFSEAATANPVQLLDVGGAGFSEIAGCVMRSPLNFILGNNFGSPSLDIYNSTFSSPTVGAIVTAMAIHDSDGFVIAGTNPTAFLSSSNLALTFRGGILVGAPTVADIIWAAIFPSGWKMVDMTFSDTPGIPRFATLSAGNPSLANATKHFITFNTKVGGQDGQPLIDVPVVLSSNLEGVVVDTKTLGDGDISFTNGTIGIPQMIYVRDSYISSGTTLAVRDRVFTLTVNGYGGVFPPNPNYETRRIIFEIPGQDSFRGAYQPGGGDFRNIEMPIMLKAGAPSAPVILEECSL